MGARYVPIIFTADTDGAVRAVRQMTNAFDELDETSTQTSKGGLTNSFIQADLTSRAFAFLGRETLQLARDFRAFANESIQLAGELQQNVANSLSIKPELDTSQVRRELSDMQRRVPQTSKQLAESLYDTFSSINVTQAQGLQLVEKFAKGATAAVTDAKTFGTATIGVMNAYGKKVEDVDHIMDVYFNTVAGGVVSGQELASNLGVVTQAAKNMGVDFDNLGGLIAGVTKEGGNAAQNINNLANTLQKLPTKEVQKELQAMHIETKNANGEFLPILDVLDQLKEKLDKLSPAARAAKLQEILPDAQARTGLQTILSQLEFIHQQVELNTTAYGASASAYSVMSNTYETSTLLQENAIRSLKESVGEMVITNEVYLKSNQLVTEQINGYTDATREAGSETQQFVENVTDSYATIKAHTIPFVGFMTKSIEGLMKGLLLIVTAVVYGIAKSIETIVQISAQGVTNFINFVIDGMNKLQSLAAKLAPYDPTGTLTPLALVGQIPRIPEVPNFLGSDKLRENLGKTYGELKYIDKSLNGFIEEGRRVQTELNAAREHREAARRSRPLLDEQVRLAREADRKSGSAEAGDLSNRARALNGNIDLGSAGGAGRKSGALTSLVGQYASNHQVAEFRNAMRKLDPALRAQIVEFASRAGIPQALAFAQIFSESSFDTQAVSKDPKTGAPIAYSLTQFTKGTAAKYGYTVAELMKDPKKALTAWSRYMGDLFNEFGDWELAVLAYHQGPDEVRKLVRLLGSGNEKAIAGFFKNRPNGTKYARKVASFANLSGDEQFEPDGMGRLNFFLKQIKDSMKLSPVVTEAGQLATLEKGTALFNPVTGKRGYGRNMDEEFRRTRADEANLFGAGGQYELLALRERNFEQEKLIAKQTEWLTLRHQEFDQSIELGKIEEQLRYFRAQNADRQFTEQRRLLLAKSEQLDLEKQLLQVQDEIATGPYNESLRIQLAMLRDIAQIRQRDEQSITASNRAQLELSDKTIYHATQANAKVLEFLAQQKGLTDIVADAKIGILQKSFDGIDSVLDRIIPKAHGFGDILKQIIGDLLKLDGSKWLSKLLGLDGGIGPGGTPSFGGGGGGFNLGNIFNMFGGGGGNGSSGGGIFGTIRNLFGWGGRASAPSTALTAGVGSNALSLGSSFGGSVGLGALLSGGGGTAAGASAGGGMAAMGAGGAAAAGGAAGGGSLFGSLGALFTNPWTAVVAGAAIGGFMLWKHFKNGTEKELREAIQSEYQVSIKDMKTLSEIKQIGEQTYGKGQVSKHLSEVIHLDQVKEIIRAYAESTGQTSNKLVTEAQLKDPNYSGNNFVKRIDGGIIPGRTRGFDHVPILGDGGEFMLRSAVTSREGIERVEALNEGRATITPNVPKLRVPSINAEPSGGSSQNSNSSGGGMPSALAAAIVGALNSNTAIGQLLLKKLKTMSPGALLDWAANENPNAFADGLDRALDGSHKADSLKRKLGGGGTL